MGFMVFCMRQNRSWGPLLLCRNKRSLAPENSCIELHVITKLPLCYSGRQLLITAVKKSNNCHFLLIIKYIKYSYARR